MVGFVCISPQLDEFFFEVVVDGFAWSRRCGSGQDPNLRTSFPFINVQPIDVCEGVGDLLPQVLHDWVCGVHKLVETEFVKEPISLLSVSVEDGGFFPLKGFFVPSN